MCLELHSYGLQHFEDSFVHGFRILPSGRLQDKRKIVLHASVHQQLKILENYAHPASEVWYVFVLYAVKLESACVPISFVKRVLCDYRSDDGCFSCSYFADDIYEISGIYFHIQAVYYSCFSVDDICVFE